MKSLFALTAAVLLLLLCASCATSSNHVRPYSESANEYTDAIAVEGGLLRGMYSADKAVEFYGAIPYAAPPVGNLRWREPQDASAWNDIRDASHFPPVAMQYRAPAAIARILDPHAKENPAYATTRSEDCLYLNVWKPSGAHEKLPVIVYFHGGALIIGGSMEPLYHGEHMAREHNIIMVTVGYRLGVFGYFAHESLAAESEHGTTGNYGLLDQIKALEWVHDNIACFGGDAQNVTIAGQSAGASSVNALCASPLAQGLFVRAIAASSSLVAVRPFHTFSTMETALADSKAVMKHFRAKTVAELRALPAEKLVRYLRFFPGITVDGYALPQSVYELYRNGSTHETALLHGYNADEAGGLTLFLLLSRGKVTKKNYSKMLAEPFGTNWRIVAKEHPGTTNRMAQENYMQLVTSAGFGYPHRNWSRSLTERGIPVYEYYFTKTRTSHKKSSNGYSYVFGFTGTKNKGNQHGGELPYAYGNMMGANFDANDFVLRTVMMSYWANFARTGNPNASGLPHWESYAENGKLLEIGNTISMKDDVHAETYTLIDTMYAQ